jgi:hypothetical protein
MTPAGICLYEKFGESKSQSNGIENKRVNLKETALLKDSSERQGEE